MHPELINRFPRLGFLYKESAIASPDNYFGIYDAPSIFPGTEEQFAEWERLLQLLDDESYQIFLKKAVGPVSACDERRGWTQLVEAINEVRGYEFAQTLGFPSCRLLDKRGIPFPDIEAEAGSHCSCLIEVKTVQESDVDVDLRGHLQRGEHRLPERLKHVLRKKYSHAVRQIAGHPRASKARKICFMIINLDLPVALVSKNRKLLDQFLARLQGAVEIQHVSQYWSSQRADIEVCC